MSRESMPAPGAGARAADPAQAQAQAGAPSGLRSPAALRWAGLALAAGLAAVAVVRLDLGAIGRSLAGARVELLALAAAGAVGAVALQAGRWLALVRPLVGHARKRDAFGTLLAAYAIGLVLPARAADLARAHLLARRTGASTAALTATSFLDRLVSAVGLLAALALLAASSELPPWLARAGAISGGLAALALIALWLVRPRQAGPGRAEEAPPAAASAREEGFRGLAARLRAGLVAVGRPRALGASALLALAAWAAEVGVTVLTLRAFGLPSGPEPAVLVVVASTLSSVVALSPGNAGPFEVACVLALAGLGVPGEPALAFALGYHALHLVPVGLLGGAWLLVQGWRWAGAGPGRG